MYLKLRTVISITLVGLAFAVLLHLWSGARVSTPVLPPSLVPPTTEPGDATGTPVVTVVAENLTIPWEVLFLPDGEIVVTERSGTVLLLRSGRELEVPSVAHTGEGGLLGAALHPQFSENRYLYLYQTTEADDGLRNRITRYHLVNDALLFDRIIIDALPGARFHDGGRIAFGPDGMLYATIGDALRPDEAQNQNSLEGTIIRITPEGEIPSDNPFGTAVYSYGHRNPQGLAWDGAGNLWSSEHGRSGIASGYDELNLITPGGNYGWPDSEGDTVLPGTITPKRHSGATTTWAPASAAYLNGSIYFAGLRGEALYEAHIEDGEVTAFYEHLKNGYGRLRTVIVGPDGMLYVTTSNRDGRGDTPASNDDLLLRVDPSLLTRESVPL